MITQLPGSLGTETIRNAALAVLKASKLDKDGNGKIDAGEISNALLSLAPTFFSAKELLAEAKDYTKEELFADVNWLITVMPSASPYRTEVTRLVVAILNGLKAGVEIVAAAGDLKKKSEETGETEPAVVKAPAVSVEDQKKRPGSGQLVRDQDPNEEAPAIEQFK